MIMGIVSAQTSCGDNVTADLTLTENLDCIDSTGLIIGADNLTLDCDGFTINGNGVTNQPGIDNSGFDNVTIKNCIINDFDNGIIFHDGADYGFLENNTAISNFVGFYFANNVFNTLINNTATGSTASGFTFGGCSNNILINNTATSNGGRGFNFWSLNNVNNSFTGNRACSNTEYDLADSGFDNTWAASTYTNSDPTNITYFSQLHDCSYIPPPDCGTSLTEDTTLAEDMECEGVDQVSYALAVGAEGITLDCNGHSITGNGIGIGVKFSGVTGATIKNCQISGFSQGILSGNIITSNNYILNNTLQNNSQYGIAIRQASDYTIQYNEITNSSIGIRVVASSGNVIDNNTVINPLDKGISFSDAENSNITDNTIQNADVNGIYLYTTGGGSNNLVQGNNVSLSETDVAPLSKHGIVIEDNNNQVYDNTVDCTSINADYTNMGIWISGAGGNAENNVLSGNEISNCYYGFTAWSADYFEIDDEDYHDNTYGVFLQGTGTSLTLPLIENSKIYDNNHGVYAGTGSYANIVNTNFTNNTGGEGGPLSGIHVSSDSSAYVTNGIFTGNGGYGIYDEGPEHVYWTLTEDTYCTDNNIEIANGWIIPMGGSIIADNCTITINGEVMNLSGGQTGSYSEAFDESINNIFGNSSYGVEGEIHTEAGTYTGDLIVNFYEENPGGTGFLLADFGLWVDASLNPEPADLQWWILKIYYTDEDLENSGLNEEDLVIQFYNASDDTWTTELNQGVNEEENYVWANLTHFSIFGIFESAVTAASTPEAETTPRATDAGINGYSKYLINESQIAEGYLKQLGIGGTIEFKINNQPHNITLKSITATTATIEVSSTLQQATLKIGEEKKFDVTEDGIMDVSVTLNSIEGVRASITVKYLPPEEARVTPAKRFGEKLAKSLALKIIGVIILIIASIAMIRAMTQRKKKK